MYHRARDSERQRASAATDGMCCGSMLCERVHIPTAGTQSLTDRLSDGYRHNIPSDSLSLYHGTHTIGHRNGTQARTDSLSTCYRGTIYHRARDSAPQRLQMACAAALCYASAYTYPQEHPHRAHRRAQTASAHATCTMHHTHHRTASAALCYASAYTYPQTASAALCYDSRTDPHRTHPPSAQAAALCYVCAYTYPQTASAHATGTMYHTHHRHRLRLYHVRAATIGARIPIGHRNGYSAPQPLPWYTDHRGTGTATDSLSDGYRHRTPSDSLSGYHRTGQKKSNKKRLLLLLLLLFCYFLYFSTY